MAIYYIMKPWYKKGGGYVLDPVLNNNSWEAIQWAAQNGVASSTWSVGDRKAVTLNGTVGVKTFSNQTVYAYILGFNHNASVEGNNTIHFQFGFDALTGGNHIVFIDSSYGNTGSSPAFKMNTSRRTNSGGWQYSYMRNTIIPAFISAMPSDLQSALKTVTKYTDNARTSKHDTSSYVTSTQDKVFVLAECEIWGGRWYANQYEQNSQAQYDYYRNGGSKVTFDEKAYWYRSPYYDNGMQFCGSTYDGRAYHWDAYTSFGFAPAFVVG